MTRRNVLHALFGCILMLWWYCTVAIAFITASTTVSDCMAESISFDSRSHLFVDRDNLYRIEKTMLRVGTIEHLIGTERPKSVFLFRTSFQRGALAECKSLSECKTLRFLNCSLTDEEVDSISKLPMIEDIEITDSYVTDQGLANISSVRGIKRLEIGSRLFPPRLVEYYSHDRFSGRIVIQGQKADSARAIPLVDRKALRLDSCNIVFSPDKSTMIIDQDKEFSTSTARLEPLIVKTALRNEDLENIELVNLSLGTERLKWCGSVKSLKSLRIKSCDASDSDFESLSECSQLSVVEICDCGISERACLALVNCDGLRRLVLVDNEFYNCDAEVVRKYMSILRPEVDVEVRSVMRGSGGTAEVSPDAGEK